MQKLSHISVGASIMGKARRLLRYRVVRLSSFLLFAWMLLGLTDRVSYLYANQSRAPYKIVGVQKAPLVTIIDAELHQVYSVPDLKELGDRIAAQRAPHRRIMIDFYQGHRGENTKLASYQDGQVYLCGEYGRGG